MGVPRLRLHPLVTSGLIAAWVLYVASLALPVFQVNGETWKGGWVLLLGALGMLDANFAWLANPLFLFTSFCVVYSYDDSSLVAGACIAGAVAPGVALTSYRFHRMCTDGGCSPVSELGVGFYVWLSAMLVLLMASAAHAYLTVRPRSPVNGAAA